METEYQQVSTLPPSSKKRELVSVGIGGWEFYVPLKIHGKLRKTLKVQHGMPSP
jgi:hypothetical protein